MMQGVVRLQGEFSLEIYKTSSLLRSRATGDASQTGCLSGMRVLSSSAAQ